MDIWVLYEETPDNGQGNYTKLLGVYRTTEELYSEIHRRFRFDETALASIQQTSNSIDTSKIRTISEGVHIVAYYDDESEASDNYVLKAERFTLT